ncbi:MAG: MIP/aquaporin family protein [Chloroflexota bacterium]
MGDREALQQAIVEFIGPFALVFLGAGSIIMTGGENLVAIALAHGLAIGVMIAAAGHISGGVFNPAVTVGLAIAGKLTLPRTIIYIGSQLLGGVAAALALVVVFRSDMIDAVNLGTPVLGDISQGAAILAEAILTFFLMFVIFGAAVDQRSDKSIAPLAIGLTITADIFAMGALTGAAMNPARHFGPALVEGLWSDWFVYWIGPIAGAAVASVIYNWVLLDERVPGAAPGDEEGAQLPDQEQPAPRRRRRRR